MITEAQRAERTKYIGGSDAAGVLGLSRWKTPLEVWALKTGQIPDPEVRNELAVELGNELEEVCARLFTKRTGKKVQRVNETVYDKEHPFLAANLDRRIVGEDAVLEIKTAGAWAAKQWEGEEVPQEVVIQVLHQLMVTGKSKGYACCLIGGNLDFHIKPVFRDDALIKQMREKEIHFWKTFVEPNVMPTIITKNDGDILNQLFPAGPDETPLELGDEANRWLDMIEGYKADAKALEALQDQAENEVKALLKDKQFAVTDRWKVSWRESLVRRIDTARMKKESPATYMEWSVEKPERKFVPKKIKA
jgi:putative phage-type endonuclease